MKLALTQINALLQRHDLPPEKIKAIQHDLETVAKDDQDEEPSGPPVKYQSILVATRSAASVVVLTEQPMFILEFREDLHENHLRALDAFRVLIADHNNTAKKSKRAISIGDAFQLIPAKLLKAAGFKIRVKSPVLIVETNNALTDAERGMSQS